MAADSLTRSVREPTRTGRAAHKEGGHTFVELLVAMAVAAVGLTGFLGTLAVMGPYEAETHQSVLAALCAQEKMEELRYELETGEPDEGEIRESLEMGPYCGMERTWRLRAVASPAGLREIEVECAYSWKGEKRRERLVSLAAGGT